MQSTVTKSRTVELLNNKNVWKLSQHRQWNKERWNVISDWLEFLIVGLLVSDSGCKVKRQKSLGVTQRRESKETGFGVAFSSASSTGPGVSGSTMPIEGEVEQVWPLS